MSRTIKFRGLSLDDKPRRWVYGYYVKAKHNEHYIIPDDARVGLLEGMSFADLGIYPLVQVNPETVGQLTGLSDKNGKKEVYVGDDIYFSMSETQHYKGYVKWSGKGLCYVVECYWQKQDEIPCLCDGFEMRYKYKNTCVRRLDSECFDIEIIGSIHDNPIEG